MNRETRLKRITLRDYRCFHDLGIDFDERLTVLVANNGYGKTAVLDAIAISLSPFVSAFHTGKRIGIAKDDVRLQVMPSETRQMEPQYPCVLECEGIVDGKDVQWQRRRNTSKSNNTHKEANSLIDIGQRLQEMVGDVNAVKDVGTDNIMLPLMAYYGTGRLWSQKKMTEKKTSEAEFFSRTAGFMDCLDPSSSYKYFVDWFRHVTESHDEELRDRNEKQPDSLKISMPYGDLLESVSGAVNSCLKHTGWGGLRFSYKHKAPIVKHPEYGELKVGQLSDGLRNMIAMVADIAHRATRLNSHLKAEAAKKTQGIVLIDEVDMHLHPEWQQSVLQSLRDAFPGLQFIVTTHSPQVLSAIKREHIRLLEPSVDGEDRAAVPMAESYARPNADVILGIMHVDPTAPFSEQGLLKKYSDLVEQGDIREPSTIKKINQIKGELEETLGQDHPDLVRLSMVRSRREILDGELSPEGS